MEQYRIRRVRAALLALTAAGGLLLTGCSASGDGANGSSYDGGNKGGGYAPAPEGEQQGSSPDSPDSSDSDSRDVAPEPDYLSTFALDVDTASYGYARRTLAEGSMPDPQRSARRSSSTASARTTTAPTATASRSPSTAPAPTRTTGPWSASASPPAPPRTARNARRPP